MNLDLNKKLEDLKEYLKTLGSVAVAYSSGVDSTFLLKVAREVLGDQVIALTASSASFPKRELEEAVAFCEREGIAHHVFNVEQAQLEAFRDNPPDRCYHCKKVLFTQFKMKTEELGYLHLIEGSNVDDLGDYRPGMRAIQELAIKSPLKECGLTKAEIRSLSQLYSLTTWDKPSFACLASRFVYGESITKEKLHMVEQAEELILSLGFHQFRVRIHGTLARIEVEQEAFEQMMRPDIRELLMKELKSYGFSYVTLDLQGYRMGSMNESLLRKS